MSLFGWWRKRQQIPDHGLGEWRQAWDALSRAPTREGVEQLKAQLEALGLPADDVEIEREMLDGIVAAVALAHSLDGGLPTVDTGHRIVGTDHCHFSAPASRAEDDAQTAGRLLLTSRRAIFVGGAAAVTLPWHAVAETAVVGRDLVLARRDRDAASIFRCNSYADALCARLIAERLAGRRGNGRV